MKKQASGAKSNGSRESEAAVGKAAKPAVRPSDARNARMAQGFAQIVAVMMRDPSYKTMRIADLEWLVLPAVLSGQYKLGHARTQQGPDKSKDGGIFVPVAVALWARVSPAIDKALTEGLDKQLQLRPNQWATGDIPWLIAAAGDQRTLPAFLKQLAEQEFKGQQVKVRARGPDGKFQVKTFGAKSPAA